MATAQAPFGTSFESILPITGVTAMTGAQANTNLVLGISGMPATVTLPTVAQMVSSQTLSMFAANLSTSGGTMTLAAASGDTLVGTATIAAGARGVSLRHDGLKTIYVI